MTDIARREALALIAGGGLAAAMAGVSRAGAPTAAPPPDRELMVPVEGGRIYVRVNGRLDSGKPPLILAHGGPGGAHAVLLPSLPLADERAVILYDQLDCGRSDTPGDPANWTVPRYVSEVDAIRRALGLERCHLLGHSWGGSIAAEYAIGRPAGLNSVILASPLISTAVWIADTNRLRATLPPAVRSELDRCERQNIRPGDAACDRATDAFYGSFTNLELPPAYVRAYRKTLPMRFNARLYETMWGPSEFRSDGTLKAFDAEPRLGRIQAPALYLVGSRDTATPASARRFAARTPGAEVQIVPGASHSVPIDQPEAWVAAIKAWTRRHDAI